MARQGNKARLVKASKTKLRQSQGKAKARQGKARQGKAKPRQGKAKARQGKARQGKARQGKARQQIQPKVKQSRFGNEIKIKEINFIYRSVSSQLISCFSTAYQHSREWFLC